jgi:hypothetical protein
MIARTVSRWRGVFIAMLVLMPSAGGAQNHAAEFDITRAQIISPSLVGPGTRFEPFRVRETQLLRGALRAGTLDPLTSLLVLDRPGGRLALVTDQMAIHHVAQGETNGDPWLVSFCSSCNTGVGMVPRVDGRIHRFVVGARYNGLVLLRDEETSTLWDHITGEALHGPLKGKRLPIYNLLHMSAERAIETYPHLYIAISDRPIRRESFLQKLSQRVGLPPRFAAGLPNEDTRRPTLDLGLGVWSTSARRYYPMETVLAASNAVVDEFGDRTLVVYYSAREGGMDTFYAPTSSARWEGDELRLDGGRVLRKGVLYDRAGKRLEIERPMQLFTRWYGFALTFPQAQVYEPPRLGR